MSPIDDAVDDLSDELDVGDDKIRESVENLILYDVPIEEAKPAIRRQYEGDSQ